NPVFDLGWNLDTDGTAGLIDPTSQSGSLVAPLNAGIGGLQFNGGPTRTHALAPASPAVDTGSCDGWGGAIVTIDQRNEPRVGPCDVGAYETPAAPGGPWLVTVLHPGGSVFSRAYGVHGIRQAGEAAPAGAPRAARWEGTPSAWVNLDPPGTSSSVA